MQCTYAYTEGFHFDNWQLFEHYASNTSTISASVCVCVLLGEIIYRFVLYVLLDHPSCSVVTRERSTKQHRIAGGVYGRDSVSVQHRKEEREREREREREKEKKCERENKCANILPTFEKK